MQTVAMTRVGAERILNGWVTFAATVDRQGEADHLLETFSPVG